MSDRIRVVLKSGKDQSVRRLHPWVFSGAIKKIYGDPAEGDLVNIYDNKDEFLASGHYQVGSIAVRIISFDESEISPEFWFERIRTAYMIRKQLGLAGSENTNVYRLVNAEGDGLPGLIIDFYAGNVVLQVHSIGVYRNIESIADALKKIYGSELRSIYNKSEATMPFKGPIEAKNGFLLGTATEDIITENSLKFRVNWNDGQKTGFFIDQRENRRLLQQYSNGRTVLNMFSYTGGFSVYALKGHAREVHSVDSSAKAVELLNENIKLNFDKAAHTSFAVDAFEFLNSIDNKYS